jgi:protease I
MEKVLLLAENGFEDKELMYPYYRFQEAGYQVVVVAPKAKETYNGEHGLTITSDLAPADVNIDDYMAVIVPGGRAPDRMRLNNGLVKLVKDAAQKGKVIAAICHGAQLLIEADVVKGKRMTCYMSVATDLKNAGAVYEDKSVVVDGKFVTSRFPADLPDFCRETLRVLGKK